MSRPPSALPVPRTAAGREGLAALLADPAHSLIVLDYDGTLAPIVLRPQDASPQAGARAVLAELTTRFGTVVILTGRAAATVVELADLSGLRGLAVVGQYGLDRWQDGVLTAAVVHPGIAMARSWLPALLADAGPGVQVEDKGHSLVVHTRPAADPVRALAALRDPIARLAAAAGLVAEPGRLVMDLVPPEATKGAALRLLVSAHRPAAALCAGDDLGDLSSYREVEKLRATGIPGVCVAARDASGEVPAELLAAADLVVDGPSGMVAFLAALVAVVGEP